MMAMVIFMVRDSINLDAQWTEGGLNFLKIEKIIVVNIKTLSAERASHSESRWFSDICRTQKSNLPVLTASVTE